MSHVKKILIAISFSKYAPANLKYAAGLASDLEAEVIAANVINVRDVKAIGRIESMGYEIDADDYVKGLKKERIDLFEELIKDLSFAKGPPKLVFKVGHPFDQLLKIVKEEAIDLVVMGQKGRTDLEHVLLGSVAEKMIRHSPVPVLIVKPQ